MWDHSSFRKDAVMRRTGAAAMMTVYGPRSEAERTIARVGRDGFSPPRLRVRRLADQLRPPFFEPSSLRFVQGNLRPLSNVVSQTGEPCPTPITRGFNQSAAPESRHSPEPCEGKAGTMLLHQPSPLIATTPITGATLDIDDRIANLSQCCG
ncbi:hypothetical protein [Rhizobium leguminosarum]|uniref:hypothetical protein n=1 Tax=Rhizobium leguminosarum TaxID=384 RepID=UPI0039656B9C